MLLRTVVLWKFGPNSISDGGETWQNPILTEREIHACTEQMSSCTRFLRTALVLRCMDRGCNLVPTVRLWMADHSARWSSEFSLRTLLNTDLLIVNPLRMRHEPANQTIAPDATWYVLECRIHNWPHAFLFLWYEGKI